MKKFLIAFLMLIFTMPVCLAADLNAPAQKQVTVKSEIQRGNSAIDAACESIYDVRKTIEAFNRVLRKNQQDNTDTDAFLLGAYFEMTSYMDIYSKAEYRTDNERKLAKESFTSYYKKFREKQQTLGLNDKEFCDSLGMIYDNVKKMLDEWDKQVKEPATN